MKTCCPIDPLIGGAMMRTTASGPPPTPDVTIRTGLSGKFCACVECTVQSVMPIATTDTVIRRISIAPPVEVPDIHDGDFRLFSASLRDRARLNNWAVAM